MSETEGILSSPYNSPASSMLEQQDNTISAASKFLANLLNLDEAKEAVSLPKITHPSPTHEQSRLMTQQAERDFFHHCCWGNADLQEVPSWKYYLSLHNS